ncbi:MAG: 30S ribosomal protein S6 [Candidatus Paceibacterota bacterium]|jgi:ribosomal protein S6
MTNYEVLYILPSSLTSKEIADNFKDIRENIEKLGAKMLVTLVDHPFLVKAEASREEETEELKGLTIVKKKLAYPIKKNKIGFYCLINFSIEGADVHKIDRYLALNNTVLRYIIVQADPMTVDELALLHKLFARKRAEQEKEEKDREKEEREAREEKKEARIEKPVFKEMKKEEAKEEVKEEAAPKEEKKEEKEEVEAKKEKEKKEVKKEKEEEKAPKKEKKEVKKEKTAPKEEKSEESEEEPKEEKKKDSGKRKKKIKLEDLEDKLDEILEDTMI